jgi:ABC-type lipoprotein export system ATPase subunit
MITLSGVTKEYRLDEKRVITPVRDVNLEIAKGELIIIIGRSGSGKTTLLNLTAGLVKPTQGNVIIDNVDLSGMNDKQLSALRNRKIGFVFQFPSLFPNLTVQENVLLPAGFETGKVRKSVTERAKALLHNMDIPEKSNVLPKQLSAGEQKRVVIARALINHPEIVLADEPTSDLDAQTEIEIMELLKKYNEAGVTFVVVTHNLQLLRYATRAFKMENNRLNDITQFKNLIKLPSELFS